MEQLLYGLLLATIIPGAVLFHQDEYVVTYERSEVVKMDPKYISSFKIHNFKHNRTHAASNMSIEINADFGRALMIHVEGYKLASNEYRLFPIIFSRNVCHSIDMNEFGVHNMYDCGSPPKCPMAKGKYNVCNWIPDQSKFPPHVPSGSYRLDFKFTYLSQEFLFLQLYMSINYPIKEFEKKNH